VTKSHWLFVFSLIDKISLILIMSLLKKQLITLEPGKRNGKPCIRGMRITVYDVLSYLAAGMNSSEIIEDFPELTEQDIIACLSYAADSEKHTRLLKSA